MQVAVQEMFFEVSASAEVQQVQLLFLQVVKVVCRIGVRLHDLPLKQLSKAELKHKRSYSVAHFLTFVDQCVNFNSFYKLRTKNFFRRQMFYYFWDAVLGGAY